jgi:hypothetical protein
MANIAIRSGTDAAPNMGSLGSTRGNLNVKTALRLAWATWVVMLLIPFFLFLGATWTVAFHESPRTITATPTWFLAASAYLLVVVPASFFWRSRLFKPYYSGQPIAPANYLYGMLAMWVALEFGGIIALLGCFVTGSLLPCLLPALVAFMFYVTLWPNGRSMDRHFGDSEDASVYEEPR